MKSIKIYLFPLILFVFFTGQAFSQNELNTNGKENNKINHTISETDSILIYGYFTEKDYNEIHGIKSEIKSNESEFYYGDENSKNDKERKRERDSFFGEVAAELIVEVVVNTLFVIAAFWH